MSLFPLPAFDHYWAMWNERDPSRIRDHLRQAVIDDFIFCDPLHFHVGHDALEANVLQFHAERPGVSFALGSQVDTHHNRHRYEWHLIRNGRVLVVGFDFTTVADDGRLERIDGFFGPLRPLPADCQAP